MPDSTVPRSKRQAWVPYVLLFLFAAPFVLSWWMINFTQLGRDGGAYSHGDLLQPPRVVPDRTLLDPLADARSRHLYGKWNIVYLG